MSDANDDTTPDLAHAASDFRMATFRLARRLRSQRAVDTMSDGQFAVLAALTVHGAHTLGQLQRLGLLTQALEMAAAATH